MQFIDDLEQLNGYKVFEKPKCENFIGSRWVCKKKYYAEGNLFKFKSKLTPFRYQQKYGIDYLSSNNKSMGLIICRRCQLWKKSKKGRRYQCILDHEISWLESIYGNS